MERLPIKEKIAQFRLKRNGRSIPMGIGCAWFGEGDYHATAKKDSVALLHKTYEEGFRYYDTSRTYNNSEVMVGEFVKEIDRSTIFLATKSRYNVKELGEEEAFEQFKRNFYESFERLHTDHIDLFQIHDVPGYDCCEKYLFPFLHERKAEGLIDYVGMGLYPLRAHEMGVMSGNSDSCLSFLCYSLLKRSAEPLIKLCHEKGCAFINASCLHFGIVKGRRPGKEPNEALYGYSKRVWETYLHMKAACDRIGVDPVTATLQISLLNPYIDMTLNGINRESNLISTLEGLDSNPIYPEQWAEIYKAQEEIPYMFYDDMFV